MALKKKNSIKVLLPNKTLTITEGEDNVDRILIPLQSLKTYTETDLAIILKKDGSTIKYRGCTIIIL